MSRLIAGYNVDKVDNAAGLRELEACGYDDERTRIVIDYALARHARGEEDAAQRMAIDSELHGVSMTCWYRILAASCASAAAEAA